MEYGCDHIVVMCSDFRFWRSFFAWVEENCLWDNFDLVAIYGGQKNASIEYRFFSDQLRKGVELHDPETIILIAHRDCGAYGGSKTFANWDQERAQYWADLRNAEAAIRAAFPKLKVRKIIINFSSEKAGLPQDVVFEDV